MVYSFRAKHIFAEDNGHTVTVGFSDDEFEPSQSVILQLAHQFDDQDEQMGMDKVFIQLEDQLRSTYGGIRSITIRGNFLVFELEENAKINLQVDGRIEIALDDMQPKFSAVISQLEKIAAREGLSFTK